MKALQTIYGLGSVCEKSDWFKVFQGKRQFDLVSTRNRHEHGIQRRLVAQIYSKTSLRDQEEYIDITLKQLFFLFDERLNKSFDISEWIQFWSFGRRHLLTFYARPLLTPIDTIGMITFSKSFGFLEAGKDWNSALHQIRAAGDSAAWLGQNPWLYNLFQRLLFPLFGNPFAIANRNGAVREFAITQASVRQKQGAQAQPDIMQKLLQVHDTKPHAFNADAVRSMVATNVFGGAEATTSSTRAIIYYVVKHPAVMSKLQQEIDQICNAHAWPPNLPVSLHLAESMTYLHAVIYESMRLHPANGLPLARVSPPEGLEINGHFFPPGVQVTVYSWALHRKKSVVGEDALEFKPERWLDDKKSQDLHRCFMSFGYGSRGCLGRNLAWMEMLKITSSFFRRYDARLQDPDANWVIEGGFIKGQKDIKMVLKAR